MADEKAAGPEAQKAHQSKDSIVVEFLKTGTEYNIELTKEDAPCQVKIGGTTEKFVPNINMQKWDDECWLNINHPDLVGIEQETLTDNKITLTIGNNTHRYFVNAKGKLEYDIELASIPVSNKIELALAFPKGLRFAYQPVLTQEQIDSGRHRPENVVGSYAVYWCKGNNQYKTGKFCHIYRPLVYDSDGKKIWGDLDITGNVLTVTIDQTWLDKAVYPVVVDPVLGYDTAGASNLGNASYVLGGCYTTDGSGGVITKFHCAVESINVGAPGIKMAVSDTDGSNDPSGQTRRDTASGSATVSDDVQLTPDTGFSLSASTEYYIGWIPENGDTDVKYDSGDFGDAAAHYGTAYASEFANPMTSGYQDDSEHYSIWIDYAAAAGGLSLPIAMAYYGRIRRTSGD